MSYLTIEELKSYNVIESIYSSEDVVKLQSLLNYCSFLIDSYVGFSFKLEEDETVFVDGSGTNKIALHKRIDNIKSVKDIENMENITIISNPLTNNGYNYNISNMRIIGKKEKTIISLNEKFKDGVDNIVVTADFGWSQIPYEVIESLVILCNSYYEYLNDSEILSRIIKPYQSERIGDYAYSRFQKGAFGDFSVGETTGNPGVDSILSSFKDDFSIGVV